MFPLTYQCDSAGWVAAAHRVVMDTLRVWLSLIRGFTLLSRHHSPSLSIVDEFNFIKRPTPTNPLMCSPHKYNQIFVAHLVAKLTGFQCAYQQLRSHRNLECLIPENIHTSPPLDGNFS